MKRFLFPFLAAVMMATAAVSTVRAELPVLGKAPAWKLKDLQGKEVSSADFKGKVVVIDFWATWCPPCRKAIPELMELQKKYADKGLVIIGISMDENRAELEAFVKKMNFNYKVLQFNDDVVTAYFDSDGLPRTILIDPEGAIRDVQVGVGPPGFYEKRLLQLLK